MTHPAGFIEPVARTVAAHRLWPPRSRIIVAVSGGADSVALLYALRQLAPSWSLTLHVAHLDHGLRPTSAQDAGFVQGLAARWGIPATIERRDVSALCARAGWSLEDGARRIRYGFLLEVARRQGATRIALAHTADDQAETVLMRLVRGTGLLGLGAIPITRRLADDIWVVRPLLEVWRRDVLAELKREALAYREDASNEDLQFVRNRIRHELLPLLERRYNPNIRAALTQLAEASQWDYAYLEAAARRQWRRLVKARRDGRSQGPGLAIALGAFLRQPKALQRQLVRRAIQTARGDVSQLAFRHWLEIERLCAERPVGTILDLPGGVRLRRERERLVVLAPS